MKLKPGLYKATVRGLPDQIVLIHDENFGCTFEPVEDRQTHLSNHITDALPLFVLDLDTAEREYVQDLRYVADCLPEHDVHRALVESVADQIEGQIPPDIGDED